MTNLDTQRLEAIGVLTRSATHDLNNHMAAILTFAELVLETLPDGHAAREDLEEIRASSLAAIARTKELDVLARQLSPIGKAA
jgi:signal transduction histidine kinase